MKYYILIAVLFLTGCGESAPYCERDYDPVSCDSASVMDKDLFEMCLDKMALARSSKGGNYTANDDEDLDEVVKACKSAASLYYDHQEECRPNPRYVAQQEFCTKEQSE